MGTQQILLILLAVIIVGVSVAVGLQMQHTQGVNGHRQIMISRMNELVIQALTYRMMPSDQAGGKGSFIGFTPNGAVTSNHVASSSPGAVKLLEEDANYFSSLIFTIDLIFGR